VNKELLYKDISAYPAWSQSLAVNEWFTLGGFTQVEINIGKTCGSDPTWKEELLSYTLDYFLNLPIEKQVKIYSDNSIENYCTRLAAISLKSTSSPFYHKHRKFLMNSREVMEYTPWTQEVEYSDEEVKCPACECIKKEVEEHQDWYEKRLLEMALFEEMKPGAIAEELKLDAKSVTSNLSVAKRKISKKCKHLLEPKKKKKNARV